MQITGHKTKRSARIKSVKIYLTRLMSPSSLVKILCYTWRPLIITLTSSAFICAGRCRHQTTTSTDKRWWCQSDDKRPQSRCATENFVEERRRHQLDKVNFNLLYYNWLPLWRSAGYSIWTKCFVTLVHVSSCGGSVLRPAQRRPFSYVRGSP